MDIRPYAFFVSLLALIGCRSLHPDAVPHPSPMATNVIEKTWYSVTIKKPDDLASMSFWDKIDPVWWFKNIDDPQPPPGYRPDDGWRTAKWYVRNPVHNGFFYVIGVSDKERVRIGYHPADNFAPHGGWNVAITRYKLLYLPFISYTHSRLQFYLGWRAAGGFGIKCRLTETVEYAPRK